MEFKASLGYTKPLIKEERVAGSRTGAGRERRSQEETITLYSFTVGWQINMRVCK